MSESYTDAVSESEVSSLNNPWLLAAFEGWNDAADAASGTIDHLIDEWDAEVFAELDAEEYYDFQEVRPLMHRGDDGTTDIIWPTPTIYVARPRSSDRDVLLLRGIEPHFRWKSLCSTIVGLAQLAGVTELITLGSLLADVPHTRPTPVSVSTNDPTMRERLTVTPAAYTGPIGITTVLSQTASDAGMSTASLWAAVPHYLGEPPCPKATIALLGNIEDAMDVSLPHGLLKDLAEAWQRGADELISGDDDLLEYVRSLEAERDVADAPGTSGDAIAREFERYLRRRNSGEA